MASTLPAERADDAELTAIIAAAGAEIDAFLSIAMAGASTSEQRQQPGAGFDPPTSASAQAAQKAQLAEKERAVGTAVLKYDRAKGALGRGGGDTSWECRS